MHCPFCRYTDSRVIDSRTADDGTAIRRRRQCPECNRRFTTVETASLSVVKRSGVTEPFSRSKVLVGVRKACQGRPVTDDDLARLAQQVEEAIRAQGNAEVDAQEVGLAVLGPLRERDHAARIPGGRGDEAAEQQLVPVVGHEVLPLLVSPRHVARPPVPTQHTGLS